MAEENMRTVELTREALLDPRAPKRVELEPRPDGTVYVIHVRELPWAVTRRVLRGKKVGGKKGGDEKTVDIDLSNTLEDVVLYGVVNADGEPLLDARSKEDVRSLRDMVSGGLAMAMAMAVLEHTGLVSEEDKDTKTEDGEGNAEAGDANERSAGSGTIPSENSSLP